MKLDSKYLKKICDYFKRKPILRAYLFGSIVRDEADSNSDVDILVELDYSQPIGLEFIQMQLDLEDLLKRNVDLLSDKAVSKYIRPHIEQEKVLIYAR